MTKNILALLDFSAVTEKVVTRAGDLALFYEAKCWLIHVATPDPEFVGYKVGPQYIRDHRAGVLAEEHHKMQGYKAQLLQKGIDCETLLVQGQINATIEAEIKKLDIQMVVLGSHGRSRIHNLFVGSVCEFMLRNATVPLMVIPGESHV